MIDEPMPKGGVKELLRSHDGRAYLDKLQKRHWKDLVQPSDPLFQKIYGAKLKANERVAQKNKRRADDEWAELKEKKEYEAKTLRT